MNPAVPVLLISADPAPVVRAAVDLGGIQLHLATTPAELDARLAQASLVAVDGIWPAGAASVIGQVHRQRPGLPVVVLARGSSADIPTAIDDWIDLDETTPVELNLALRHAAERSGWTTAAARGRRSGRLELLGRIRAGILAGISEHLTVVLSHVDLLGPRLGDPAGRSALTAVRDAANACGSLVRQSQSFASRHQAVPTDLYAVLRDRQPLYAAMVGSALVQAAPLAEPLWVGVAPAETDLLILRLVLVANRADLVVTCPASGEDVVLSATAPLPAEHLPAWTALQEQAQARGVRAEVQGDRLCLIFHREPDAASHDEHLPHPARPGEHESLEDSRLFRHRR
jgi:hypothetical protein